LEVFNIGAFGQAAGPGRAPKGTGRPGYAPGDLLKLYIYGYLNRVRSSRRLLADAGLNRHRAGVVADGQHHLHRVAAAPPNLLATGVVKPGGLVFVDTSGEQKSAENQCEESR
jgi:hypothetical protein